jgi:hypothetical protein
MSLFTAVTDRCAALTVLHPTSPAGHVVQEEPCVDLRIVVHERSETTMPEIFREIVYLRTKAEQFRELADTYKTPISEELLEIARQVEERADELEEKRNRGEI